MCHRCLSYEGAVDARRKFMSHNLADKKGKDKVNEFKRLFHYVRVAQNCLFVVVFLLFFATRLKQFISVGDKKLMMV